MKTQVSDPTTWVEEYGDYLFRYAMLMLRDAARAEDAVQETFLAALAARESFSGRSSMKTWMVGILKHKIADQFRQESREKPIEDLDGDAPAIEKFFDKKGRWKTGPSDWVINPRTVLEQKEFWEIFQQCLSELPERHSNAFLLREIDDVGTREICDILKVTEKNLWVMLYRARMRLRRCLEVSWFDEGVEVN
jgi:RNA polymerase sigma-70 factor (ECF subfamily)